MAATMFPTPTVNGNNNRAGSSPKAGDGLATVVKMWTTPSAADAVGSHGGGQVRSLRTDIHNYKKALLPTPTASLANHGGPNQRDSSGRPGLQMAAQFWPTPAMVNMCETQCVGQLHPDWEEWLMGLPTGWTDIDADVAHPAPTVDGEFWPDEPPGVPRVAKGIPNRIDRLRCLGNAVVPQQFYPIYKAIFEIEGGGAK